MSVINSSSYGPAGHRGWRPLLSLGGEQWLGFAGAGEMYLGDGQHPKRPVEPDSPTGLLPLLERPFSVVLAEIQEVARAHGELGGLLARQIPLESLVLHALHSGSEHWARLALDWVGDMAPIEGLEEALTAMERADWSPQDLRHRAYKLRRSLKSRDAAATPE